MPASEKVSNGICYMCTTTCPTKVHVRDGKIVKIDIADKSVAACPRWQAQTDFVYHPDRLQYPVKRTRARGEGKWSRISWNEALNTTATNLQKVKDEYGPESVVFWVAYTKEPRPYFHRLTHAFGSPNYCTESSNCFSGTWTAANVTYGEDYSYMGIQSVMVEPETKCKIVWGCAIQYSAQRVWKEHLNARKKGLKLIVVDPIRTDIAEMADIHLQLRPGTDGALALGMMNIIIGEGLQDEAFLQNWTVGYDDLKELVREYPPERTAEITGVPANKIIEAARTYAAEKPSKIYASNTAITHHYNGVQNHRAVILLAAITGNLSVTGGNGYMNPSSQIEINDITLHERVEDMPPGVGSQRFPIWTKRYREMQSNAIVDQIESSNPYPIKAVFSAGLNTMFFANSKRMVEHFNKLDFVAVTEYFQTPGTQLADIIMPIASWLERPILLTDADGYVKLIEPAIEPVGESMTEWQIFSELAKRLGFSDMFWGGDFSKCVDCILEPMKITYHDLQENPEGIKLDILTRPEKHYEKTGFKTASGKVEIASSLLAEHGLDALPVYREPPESPVSRPDLAESYPLVMTSGARTPMYTHSQFRNIDRLRKMMPDPLLDINPADAQPRGIKSGDTVTISTPRNTITMKANVTDIIKPGVVTMPHHWPDGSSANLLVNDQTLDPISGFLPCKSQLCQVAKV